ncbi:MAG: polysulfide reductase, partial [Alphaproteobacteria bacterium]
MGVLTDVSTRPMVTGRWTLRAWLAGLTVLVAAGIGGWWVQLDRGLAVTDLTDQVVWGLYIGNFVYLVG